MTITATLAHWLCTQRRLDSPSHVQQKAVDVVFDSVGATIACSKLPEVEYRVDYCLVDYRYGVEKSARVADQIKQLAAADSVRPLMLELAGD